MASLGVHYVKTRLECRDCQKKNAGLIGIAPQCLVIEVHVGATHKYYHPKCFFEGSNCRNVLDKLSYKTALGMTGYRTLSHSDRAMIYSMFANATDNLTDDEESEEIEQRKERAVASRRAKRTQATTENVEKSKNDEDDEFIPKKRSRSEKKDKKKITGEERDEKLKRKSPPRKADSPVDTVINEDLDEIEEPREDNAPNDPKVKETPIKSEVVNAPHKKRAAFPGRGRPSAKMTAIFEKMHNRKIDELVDLELDSD